MWNQFNFEGVDGNFVYKTEGDSFYISCFSPSADLGGKKLYIHSDPSDIHPLCLGTFSPLGDGFSLEKNYPLSFFEASGIRIGEDSSPHFSLEQWKNETTLSEDSAQDPAILRAKKLTESHPVTHESRRQAEEQRKIITEKLSVYPTEELPAFGDYTFRIMDNIIHPFSLTAIDHIVHSSEFVSAFVKTGKWYIGEKKNCDVFVISIVSEKDDINPMYNASDCDFVFEDGSKLYHFVGIGLWDDGQYFCRLTFE